MLLLKKTQRRLHGQLVLKELCHDISLNFLQLAERKLMLTLIFTSELFHVSAEAFCSKMDNFYYVIDIITNSFPTGLLPCLY